MSPRAHACLPVTCHTPPERSPNTCAVPAVNCTGQDAQNHEQGQSVPLPIPCRLDAGLSKGCTQGPKTAQLIQNEHIGSLCVLACVRAKCSGLAGHMVLWGLVQQCNTRVRVEGGRPLRRGRQTAFQLQYSHNGVDSRHPPPPRRCWTQFRGGACIRRILRLRMGFGSLPFPTAMHSTVSPRVHNPTNCGPKNKRTLPCSEALGTPRRKGVMGAFSHSARTAPIITLFIPGTPENHPPTEASKQHRGCRIQDLGTRGKHQTKKNPWCTSTGGVGCRIQDLGIRGYRWWKTANFSHSAGTARAGRTVRPLCCQVLILPPGVGDPGGRGYVATRPTCGPLLILSPALKRWGPPTRQGLCSQSAHLWSPGPVFRHQMEWRAPSKVRSPGTAACGACRRSQGSGRHREHRVQSRAVGRAVPSHPQQRNPPPPPGRPRATKAGRTTDLAPHTGHTTRVPTRSKRNPPAPCAGMALHKHGDPV